MDSNFNISDNKPLNVEYTASIYPISMDEHKNFMNLFLYAQNFIYFIVLSTSY